MKAMIDELEHTLQSLAREDSYRVDAVLKTSELERTERLFFVGVSGGELGPFVRKTFRQAEGVGTAWRRIFDAQQEGARFAHLPRIFDCCEAGEDCVVIMEFIAGKTLADVVYARGAGAEVARDLFPGACDAVRELHERFTPAIIHRDIKPSNLICSGETVVLIDLGIARSFDGNAAVDTAKFGTRGFAPPEQFGFGQTDVRSDVYGLGMLLLYLLVGKIPEPSALDQVMREHNIAQAMRSVVLKATAFDPASRYQTVAELKRAFEQACIACKLVESPQKERGASPGAPEGGKAHTASLLRAGVVWDVLLAGASLLLLLMCLVGSLFPAGEAASTPFAARAVQYLSIWVLLSAPALALCDPRPLRSALPRFAACGFAKRLLLAFIFAAVAIVLFGITGGISGTIGS